MAGRAGRAATDPIGRFDLGDVPTLVPLTVRVQSFGFLPETVTFEPRRDTTLEFGLEPDPVARHMIARLGKRMFGRIGCFIIDEEPFNRWRLHSIQVDRIQRVEILEMELHNNPLAVRIYTVTSSRTWSGGRRS